MWRRKEGAQNVPLFVLCWASGKGEGGNLGKKGGEEEVRFLTSHGFLVHPLCLLPSCPTAKKKNYGKEVPSCAPGPDFLTAINVWKKEAKGKREKREKLFEKKKKEGGGAVSQTVHFSHQPSWCLAYLSFLRERGGRREGAVFPWFTTSPLEGRGVPCPKEEGIDRHS